MNDKTHVQPADLRGLGRLAIEAVAGVTDLVEALHDAIGHARGIVGPSTSGRTTGITGLVYRSIRGINSAAGKAIDAAIARLEPLLASDATTLPREAVLAALNGVLGHHLALTRNPLAISMRLRNDGQPLELETAALAARFPRAGSKLLILVHGLCMNDLQWTRRNPTGVDTPTSLASRLADEQGYTVVHLHYNSGRHVSSNGRDFAALLERLVAQWPVAVAEVALIAHSMGGLVSRSACHYGAQAGHAWLRRLRRMVFLGTPHHGAPLARGGNWVDFILGISPYSAPFAQIGKIRSVGITDLRHGNIVDEDWKGRDRFERSPDPRRGVALPARVRSYAIAATVAQHVRDWTGPIGDGLVPVDSALGRHADPARALKIPASRQWIGYGMNHMALLDHPDVTERICSWFAGEGRRELQQ